MPDSDASLIRTAAQGHPAAFAELLRRHGQAIHGYLTRRSRRDVADDLLSEVFLRAYAARGSYDSECHDARPWLYGIARNVLREHWRRSGAERFEQLDGVNDPWPEVDDRLDATARLAAVRRALSELPAGDREVLLLVTWEGLTPAEASVVVGIPQGTARSRLHRARSALRRLVDGDQALPATSSREA